MPFIQNINEDGEGFARFSINDFEFVNPVEHDWKLYVERAMGIMHMALEREGFGKIAELTKKQQQRIAAEGWKERFKEVLKIPIQHSLLALFNENSKKEQVRLLKNMTTNFAELTAFYWRAFADYGFTHSMYKSKRYQTGLDLAKLPRIIYVQPNGSIYKSGATELTDGQLKVAVETRKVILAWFIDKGEEWMCFYYTFDGIAGKENDGKAPPHIHFISDKWLVPRAEIVEAMKSGRYRTPSTCPHIGISGVEWPEHFEIPTPVIKA